MFESSEPDGCLIMDGTTPRSVRSGGLPLIRYLVAEQKYLVSQKVLDLIGEGYFELEDLENSILKGDVEKTEHDEYENSVGNKKYVIIGPDTCGALFYTVGKIVRLSGSRIYLVLTAHHSETNYE